jgi:hypothetical protein
MLLFAPTPLGYGSISLASISSNLSGSMPIRPAVLADMSLDAPLRR